MQMTFTTSTSQERMCRLPMGLDIVVLDGAGLDGVPARLPSEGDGTQVAARAHRLVARDSGEYLFVGVRGGDGAPAGRRARDVVLGPGDICFYDAHRPWALDFPERARLKVFLLPRELLGIEESDVPVLATAPVTRASQLGTLLSPFLSELADTAASQPPIGDMLAWNAVHLLATLAAEQLGRDAGGPPEAPSPLMARILRFLDLHLTDADLSPEVIAAAHHISVRYLHKLFQEEGATVGRWIQRRRLEECRRDLMLRGRGHRTIAAVANRWGFMSATHFSRVFRAAYGMSPSEWRDTASGGPR